MLKAALVALFLLPPAFFGQSPRTPEIDRLLATGKLWATVKYFHPYLAYRDVDWDKALVDALPKIRSADSRAEYISALRLMLDTLHDPATYAVLDTPSRQNAALAIENRPDGALIVSQRPVSQTESASEASRQLRRALTSAGRVVFDLRVEPGAPDYLSNLLEDPSIAKLLTRTAVDTPAQRTWVHKGLPPQSKPTQSETDPGNNYHSAFYTRAGRHLEGDSSAPALSIAFILNENSRLPAIGCALWAQGSAQVLAESSHFQFANVASAVMPMAQGVNAIVRLSEPVTSRQVAPVAPDKALEQALSSLNAIGAASVPSPLPAAPTPYPDLPYSQMRYPSTEYRILAAYKIWAAFRNFFAYRDLMDEDWDEVFTTFLPRFIAAKDAREYNLTIAEMVTHVADSHAVIDSAELDDYFGKAPVGLRLRLIEKKPVITEVLDPNAVKAGVHPGDIVTKVDGESITERFHREANYIAASTQQALGYAVIARVLNGPEASEASLLIEAPGGKATEVRLKRSLSYLSALRGQRSGDVVKLVSGNIGYVDLDRLMPDQVDGMFDRLRGTQTIIFDMRGDMRGDMSGDPQGDSHVKPHDTAASIAARLTEHRDIAAAIFNGPLSVTPDLPYGELTSSASYFFVQKLPTTEKWKYKGRTVMLIDERTISQAEHAGLFFEAANRTEFIGTPSAGADGDVTNFVIPGGITIWFSGEDVRHANGGPLQRLGLQPSLTVQPSIAGVRAGRDEVLEKAVEYVLPAKAKGSVPRVAALRVQAITTLR